MRSCIIIPIHNEAQHLEQVLDSFVNQTVLPDQLVLVNDGSTDTSGQICEQFSEKYPWIQSVSTASETGHQPGSKVVAAFYHGFTQLSYSGIDLIGKFDADIILPTHYFERVYALFQQNPKVGIAGGNLYINTKTGWTFEALSTKDKVRGPIKLYRKECFDDIGGLKHSIGWDTVDELLARFHGWEVVTDTSLIVKHLKPTGNAYHHSAKHKQGEAFKRMRYGFWLTVIASAKMAYKKRSLPFFWNTLQGFWNAPEEYIVPEEEGRFIRSYRWRNIRRKVGF
ncbi:glycosyltransferase [Altibacter sp. HG106]|uniref:glycosyltransferase n=1 Tax=Altibacter sp. HG106 TaxID=3023937 RepID=UPI0023507CA8|nr:glycosyltransferase family A protein [Altibacter sp. HG106]MDC7995957.1 glycosyltransferase family A protein [Altibacter sp. HG106]